MSDREPSSARLIGSLGFAGLFSGLLLVGIYLLTLPIIQRNQAEALQAAIFRVLPGTAKAEAMSVKGGKLAADPSREGKPPAPGEVVYRGLDETGKVIGYAIPADGSGFQDKIGLIYGFDHRRKTIVGMEVLESRETPGLGDKIILDKAFVSNFKALQVTPAIEPVKRGEKTKPNQVDCITGATISSKAVVKILNGSVKTWAKVWEDAPGGTPETSKDEGGGTPEAKGAGHE